MTTETGPETIRVQWHPDAVERAVEHARAARAFGSGTISDTPIYDLPLTWQDLAVLVDIARALEAERVDFASNAATMGYVTDQLTELLDDSFGQRPENLAAAVDGVQQATKVLTWLHAEAKHRIDEANAEINDLRERARRVRENEHIGYVEHINDLIKALGQHADPTARSLHQLIDRDVAALAEAYDTMEQELIEWRTGQRAVEASAVQWVEIRSTLDETLAAVRQLAQHVRGEEQSEPCSCNGGWSVDENYQPEDYEVDEPLRPGKGLIPCGLCNHGGWDSPWPPAPAETAPSAHVEGELPVDAAQADVLKFTHDTEE